VTTQPSLTPAAFAAKWHGVTTTEKASAQEHFIDLCRMLGEPTPHEADPIGAQFAFEKRVGKAAGGDGFADDRRFWQRFCRTVIRSAAVSQAEAPVTHT
jgi:hypothetical protein